MKHELETTHSAVLKKLLACADTAEGSEVAGYVWCSIFEVPANTVQKSEARGALARSTYWPKYAGQTTAPAQTPAQTTAADGATYKIELAVLKEGMTGSAVEAAQTLLILRGYSCGRKFYNGSERADGEFGPITKAAVEKFQTDNALSANGVIDAQTMTALLK